MKIPHPSPTIPAGYTFASENPAIPNGHNDSENTENCYNLTEEGLATAASTNLANFSAIIFSDTNATLQLTTPVDAAFRRDFSTTSKDRLLVYYDTLADPSLPIDYTFRSSLSFSEGRNSQYIPII